VSDMVTYLSGGRLTEQDGSYYDPWWFESIPHGQEYIRKKLFVESKWSTGT
jgi:hypothetical protein